MDINCNGHAINIEGVQRGIESEIRFIKRINELEQILSKNSEVPFAKPIHVFSECFNCGESPKFRTDDGGETFIAETECAYKGGFPPIEVNLDVPSGEILLFNDFRSSYIKPEKFFSINNNAGIKLYTEYYAAQGLCTHFVGNTCPSVAQVSDERLEIGSFWCEKEDGCKLPKCPMPECNRPKILGSICTDLWWYCAVDREAFEKRIGQTTEQYQAEYHATGAWPEIIRAKVTPGTYRTVGLYHIDEGKLFSFIERIK